MKYLLINPKTNNQNSNSAVQDFIKTLEEGSFEAVDVTAEGFDYSSFFKGLKEKDEAILCGGDGTINYLINHVDEKDIKNDLYLFADGTGNDFLNDVKKEGDTNLIKINEFIKDLPTVEALDSEGKTTVMKFINGVGYGIDGYCCEEADKIKLVSNKPINYTSIAIKGLLFKFKKREAKVSIDGAEPKEYKNVWLVPTMKGRYYGGGMIVTPAQDRLAEDKSLSLVVYHAKSKLKALIVFPSIFKGEHIKHTDVVEVLKASKTTEVEFNMPTALQVDGETVLNVVSYKVHY